MSANLPSFHLWRVWRVVNACLVVAVCSYVFFDLLDLDGSGFPLQRDGSCSYAAVPEDATEKLVDDFRSMADVLGKILSCSQNERADLLRQVQANALEFFPLVSSRHRGYRIGLPRSSIADPDLPA